MSPETSRRIAAAMQVATPAEKLVLRKAILRDDDLLGTKVSALLVELEYRAGSLVAEIDRLKRALNDALREEYNTAGRAQQLEEDLWKAQHPRG